MNKVLENIIIRLLKSFRAKNVQTWTIILFAVGVLNYVLQQAAQNFILNDALMQIVHYVSLAYITLSNPELSGGAMDSNSRGRIVPIDPARSVDTPESWVEIKKDSDIKLFKNTPLSKNGFGYSLNH